MKDIKITLDGKGVTNETEYVVFSVFVPKENRKDQIRFFPFNREWSIDLTNVREDTPLPTSVGYYGGRNFKLRRYVFCKSKGKKYELVFTDNKKKVDKFVSSRTEQEKWFSWCSQKKARGHLDKINKQR